jgi:DNA-binding GntR family transcriptional regulator
LKALKAAFALYFPATDGLADRLGQQVPDQYAATVFVKKTRSLTSAKSPARYIEIQRDVEERIMSSDWPPGHRIPSEHELVEHYGCSRMTVNKALSLLAKAGLITRKRRVGSGVAAPKFQEFVLEIHDIKAEILATGKCYRFEIREGSTRFARANDIIRLGVEAKARILALKVLHFRRRNAVRLGRSSYPPRCYSRGGT